MFETYRMLGREHEADLAREAKKRARAAEARRPSPSGRWLAVLHAVATDLFAKKFPSLRLPKGNARPEGRPTK